MKILQSVFISVLLFVLVSSVVFADVPVNIAGSISGPCNSFANVDIYLYCSGQIGNNSCSIDNVSTVATVTGVYGSGLNYDEFTYPAGVDVLVVTTNNSCSPFAYGNNTLTNVVGPAFETINVVLTNPFTLDLPANGLTVTNQTINFSWTNNIVNPNSTIQIDDDSGFGSIDLTQSNILDSNVTLATALIDGVYFWRVLTYIGSNFIQQSSVNTFTLANSAPTIIDVAPNSSVWLVTSSSTLTVETDIPANCAYANTALVPYNSKTFFTTTGGLTSHSTVVPLPVDGLNTFYLQCNGSNGQLMPEIAIILRRDISIPDESGASVSINSGATYSSSPILNVSWSGFTDSVSSVVGYYVNMTNHEGSIVGSFTSSSSLLFSGLSDGLISIFVWAIDSAGNIGLAESDTIIVDTQSPTYSSWSTSPNLNQFTTSGVTVVVTINDTSSLSSLPQIRYKIGSDVYSGFENMALIAGSIYSFTIPNQAPPNDWENRAGENLTYFVVAQDIHGHSSWRNRSIFINDQFNPPVFSALSSFSLMQNTLTSISLRAQDVDGDSLVFSSSNSNISIVSLNSTAATAHWSPSNSEVGINAIIFTVTDGQFNISQAVIITVLDANDDPILSSIPDIDAYEYVEFSYHINATDVDNNILSYHSNSSLFVVSSSSGIFTYVPTVIDRGIHQIKFSVTDEYGGYDEENITFNVLYCGDSICSELYESTESCNLDCKIEDDSQGFIINSKTCLGDTLDIRAVKLVERATCPFKGVIVNGWETCENLTDTMIYVEQDIQDMYVSVATLLTNEFGKTSFTPNETGSYRLRYDNSDFDENIAYFGINICSQKDETTVVDESSTEIVPEVTLPFFEEPLTTEQITKLTNTSKILYFMLLPFLFILLSVAALSTYYRYDKQKGSGSFSKELDIVLIKINKQLASITTKVRTSKTYRNMKPYFKILETQLVDAKKGIVKGFEPLIKTKNIVVPFYGSQLNTVSETSLLLQSLYGYYFKSKKSDNFSQALLRETLFPDKNLRTFCLNANKMGLPITYLFSSTKDKHELLSLHGKLVVKKSYPTLTDIKLELLKGCLVLIPLHMNSLNKVAPKKDFIAILTGYNKEGFFMLDYSFSRKKKTFIPLGVLQKSWNETGYLECAILKK